ncbi:hypothetical protein GCM10022281_08380 [Sphingomonas rosea]|jgi:hypothetical protein|uniref:DUF4402 domain-containing protein n=1 Tax=Sphingomonas rosea TaxID=335605 RepID=A0ABP7TTV1_9SPHN
MRYTFTLAALAAATAFAAPAAAQTVSSSDTIKAQALIIQPATLQRVDDLSFGTIIATPTAVGSVTIDADDGSRAFTGTGLTLSSTDVGGRGRFLGNGNLNVDVPLNVSFPAYLSNVADRTKTVTFTGKLDAAANDLLVNTGATGVFYVGVGGKIDIAAGQMPGLYDGEVTLTAQFQ